LLRRCRKQKKKEEDAEKEEGRTDVLKERKKLSGSGG
jgi:hypothetical protein